MGTWSLIAAADFSSASLVAGFSARTVPASRVHPDATTPAAVARFMASRRLNSLIARTSQCQCVMCDAEHTPCAAIPHLPPVCGGDPPSARYPSARTGRLCSRHYAVAGVASSIRLLERPAARLVLASGTAWGLLRRHRIALWTPYAIHSPVDTNKASGADFRRVPETLHAAPSGPVHRVSGAASGGGAECPRARVAVRPGEIFARNCDIL